MKNSFTILEIILTIIISSIVIINSVYFSKELFYTNAKIQNIEILKLDLLSSKIFLEKNNIDLEKNLFYKDNKLYFKNKILLENVSIFSILKKSTHYEISLEIEDKAKEIWMISL